MTTQESQLGALMNALAEASLEMSDETVLIAAQDQGEDPQAAAESVRSLLRATGKTYRQRHLRAAAAEYGRVMKSLSTRWLDLPDSAEDRRLLLQGVLARNPSMNSAFLTVQHREFKELTDADVESCLAQLAELGVLEELDGQEP